MSSIFTSRELKALDLLTGGNITQEQVAATLGITASAISQMLSTQEFKEALVERKYTALQQHNKRDSVYDELEDVALEQLRVSLPMVMRPMELTRILGVLNAAKRRGSSAPTSITQQQNIVNLIMPVKIVNKFTTNINNQVVSVGGQQLATMPSATLLKNLEQKNGNSELTESPPTRQHVTGKEVSIANAEE